MFKTITINQAKLFADVLFANTIDKPLHLDFPDIGLEIKIDSIEDLIIDDEKEGGIFLDKEGKHALRHDSKHYEIGFYFSNWYDSHLIHLNFYSKKHHQNYLTEFEIGQCLLDKHYIYFLKRTDKLAGPGSMVRLFSSAGSKSEKFERIKILRSKLGAETIEHNNNEYLVAHKLKIADLEKQSLHPSITRAFLSSWITFSFRIEEIRQSFKS